MITRNFGPASFYSEDMTSIDSEHGTSTFFTLNTARHKKASKKSFLFSFPVKEDLLKPAFKSFDCQSTTVQHKPRSGERKRNRRDRKIGQSVLTSSKATMFAPSIFYRFPSKNALPAFVFDVVIKESSFNFTARAPANVTNGRFFIYTISSSCLSTTPISIRINSVSVKHLITDPNPIDCTELLSAFGEQNWLVVDTGTFVVPFTLIGIWVSHITITEILGEIAQRGTFPFTNPTATCPITGHPIKYPTKGLHCKHRECFDAVSYINTRQALGDWTCPICGDFLPVSELILGVSDEVRFEQQKSDEEFSYADDLFEF